MAVEHGMNCFDWQNKCSDYLDGTMIGAPKKEADQHIERCAECTAFPEGASRMLSLWKRTQQYTGVGHHGT